MLTVFSISARAGASTDHMSTVLENSTRVVLEYNAFIVFMFIILGKTNTEYPDFSFVLINLALT